MMWRGRSKNDVSIGAAEAKRVNTCDALSIMIGERFQPRRDPQLQLFKINVRIWSFEMETGRDLAVFDHQHCLEQPCDAGGRFQVTKITFDRPNRGACCLAYGLRLRM